MTLTPQDVAAQRAQLWDAGYRPIPILNWDAKVPSPGKQPLARDWRQDALKDPPFCVTVPAVAHALNSGILCDGLRAIDLDIDDPALAARCRAIAVDQFGEAPIRMRRNSARCLLLYRAATGTPAKIAITGATHAKGNGCKIEVLGAGQQFVAFGRHDSGADLEWFPEAPGEVTVAQLPAVTEEGILAYLETVAPLLGAEPPGRVNGHDHYAASDAQAEPLRIAAAIAAIPNTGAPDWERWNKIGMAIFAATGGSAIGGEIFNEWSKRNACYSEAETEERWKHYRRSPPTSIGAGTLFHLAGSAFRAEPEQEAPPAWLDDAPPVDGEEWYAADPDIRAHEETIKPADDVPAFPATEISFDEWNAIPPRERVYGHFLYRKFISAIGAPGGAGKTAYATAIAFAIATWRNLLGEKVHESGAVWIYNLEDPRVELLRRVKAAAIAHSISFAEISGRLFLDSGRDRPLIIAKKMRDGSLLSWPQVPALIAEIKARGVRLLIVDPFVRSHAVEENHNDEIDFVAALWAHVADQADCAILLVHHFNKGGVGGQASSFRGATALIDASRAAVTLTTMSAEEAQKLGIGEKDRWQYVRVDNAKLNLAPPPDSAVWLHLEGVDLDNATEGHEADNVQSVKRWEPPSLWAETTSKDLNSALDLIASGPEPGMLYTASRRSGGLRWAGQVLVRELGVTEGQAAQMISTWLKSGLLTEVRFDHPKTRKEASGLRVNDGLRPS